MALNRLETSVHELVSVVVALLGIACMVNFLFFIDYAARLLRPVSILARVAEEGIAVIRSIYPTPAGDSPDVGEAPDLPTERRRVVDHQGTSAMVLAVDLQTLLREAIRRGGIIEFVPHVGDFVASEEPLFALYGGAVAVDDTRLRAAVAFGSERTLEQDPLFAFRIMVDIGLKALSPAINDPTTAVLALDQIHRLLKAVGRRHLRGETLLDRRGRVRVIFRTPNWEDFVQLSCHEIRMCGANNVQIARRLRAMLDNLIDSLPEHRHPPLEAERQRLAESIAAIYRLPGDLALAQIPDSQGLGGASRPLKPL
jgi:uncharacterized membrane protein